MVDENVLLFPRTAGAPRVRIGDEVKAFDVGRIAESIFVGWKVVRLVEEGICVPDIAIDCLSGW